MLFECHAFKIISILYFKSIHKWTLNEVKGKGRNKTDQYIRGGKNYH